MNSDKLETRDKRKQAGTIKLSARLLTVAGFVRQGWKLWFLQEKLLFPYQGKQMISYCLTFISLTPLQS